MKNELIKSTQIYWCPGHDRHIYVVKENNDVVGLNFMQGDEYDLFEREFTSVDEDLTDFYNALASYLNGEDEIERINQAMWAYHAYDVLKNDRIVEKTRRAKLKALQNQHGV
jgi:hypothetical protein